MNDVLLGLLLVISDDDGDGELICCGCWFNCCFCDVGVEEERRRRNDQRRPNGPNFCVLSVRITRFEAKMQEQLQV